MPSSNHRLSRTERRKPMEPAISLDDLVAHYLDHHRAYGRSPNTIDHYQDSFRLFRVFLVEREMVAD